MTAGVYMILNTKTDRIYIGSSKNIENRWLQHINDLNKNIHSNYKLQKDWRRYLNKKEKVFEFHILEEILEIKDNLISINLFDLEQSYINCRGIGGNLYNIAFIANPAEYIKYAGTVHSYNNKVKNKTLHKNKNDFRVKKIECKACNITKDYITFPEKYWIIDMYKERAICYECLAKNLLD